MPEDIGDSITLVDGRTLKTHGKDQCSGESCCIHNPSVHPLADAPLDWRPERALIERVCDHGVHHPDPDDRAHWERKIGTDPVAEEFLDARAEHPCDGCCTGTYVQPEPPEKALVKRLQSIVQHYGATWTEGPEDGPFPHLPDGGELRIVDALESVLRTMAFAVSRNQDAVSVGLLAEVIKYSFSDEKYSSSHVVYRSKQRDFALPVLPPGHPRSDI